MSGEATPVVDPTDVIGAALVSAFGPWGAVAALAYKFGVPFVSHLIENARTHVDPTPDEWAKLAAKVEIPGEVLVPSRGPGG